MKYAISLSRPNSVVSHREAFHAQRWRKDDAERSATHVQYNGQRQMPNVSYYGICYLLSNGLARMNSVSNQESDEFLSIWRCRY